MQMHMDPVLDEPKVVAMSQSVERMIQVVSEKLPDDITFDVRITVLNQEGEEDIELQNEVLFIVNQSIIFRLEIFKKKAVKMKPLDSKKHFFVLM